MAGLGQTILSGEVVGDIELRYTPGGDPVYSFQIIQLQPQSRNRSEQEPPAYHNVECAGEIGRKLEQLDEANLLFGGERGKPGTRFVGVFNITQPRWERQDGSTGTRIVLRPVRLGLEVLDFADRLPTEGDAVIPYEGFKAKSTDGTATSAEMADDGEGFTSSALDMDEEDPEGATTVSDADLVDA